MTESGPQHIPAGWYPTPDGAERWWDGNGWSHHVRAPQPPAHPQPGTPYQQPYAQPYAQQPYAAASLPPDHTARNILLVMAVLGLLLVGGCVAVVAAASRSVDSAVEEITADDGAPGGADNPLVITPGEPFAVRELSYAAGWSLGVDAVGDVTVDGLEVTNGGGIDQPLFVEVAVLEGTETLARIDCFSGTIAPGETEVLTCTSIDDPPATYDTVTISDAF